MSVHRTWIAAVALAAFPLAAANASLDPAPAQRDLEASLQELSALREQITVEKVPLATRLGELEQQLAQLRRQQDESLRDIDTGSFDALKLEQETKLRQDEMAYVGNILDEYVRGFETRLSVGEISHYRATIEAAKDAPGNQDLAAEERLARQFAVLDASIERIRDLSGGGVIPGQAVEPQGSVAKGRFALVGPVALFASDDGQTAGVALVQAGSNTPAVRPLETPSMNEGVAQIVQSGEGTMPFDPSRGGALKNLVQKTNLVHIFKRGGPIMWPLLFVSILATATVMERAFFVANEQRRRDPKALQALFAAAQAGDLDRAIDMGNRSKFFVARTLAFALEHREISLANALLYSISQEIKRFARGIPILDTSITIAPLLGLLGTVTGMMNSFALIGGELSAPGAITGGIAEALIATAFGLGIAIVCLIPYNILNNKVEQARQELEGAGHQLELIVRSLNETPVPAARTASTAVA